MQVEQRNDKIIFGSFPFRGHMQSVRLLCEYIGVEYQNKFFDPVEWEAYRQNEAKDWLYQKIPFMKCGDFVVTNSLAAAEYIAQKFNKLELFGKTEEQKILINSSVSFQSIIMGALALECDFKKSKLSEEEKKMKRESYWREQFYPKFKKAEKLCKGEWFFDHITIIDFCIYEDYMLFSKIYPEMEKFDKIRNVYENVAKLEKIKNYESSSRAIKQCCPNEYWKNFCNEYKKTKECTKSETQKQPYFSICSDKKSNNNKFGFCRYQKKEDEKKEDGMDLE